MSLVLDTHRKYLSDTSRIAAFRKAIDEVIKPGYTVVDLGSGTGILGLLACRAGAARVYSIELSSIVGLARKIADENRYADRITFIRGLSTRIDIPERVDLILTDQIGRLGFEAGIAEYFPDAIKRFLKPGGHLIPAALRILIAPVSAPENWRNNQFWMTAPAGLNFTAAMGIAGNTGYPVTFSPQQLLAKPAVACSVDLHNLDPDSWIGTATFEIDDPGELHGLGGWFQAQLSPNVTMTNSPLAPDRINRRNVFLPIARPVSVARGDIVKAKIRVVPSEITASWSVTVETEVLSGSPKKQRFSHSTLLGMLLSQEDLDKTHPASVPKLTPWGEARRSILELVDGHRPLGEIEIEMLRRHPNLFPSLKEAAVYVAEVVTRYTA
jgi:SAM-dependent methyltransferase